MGTNFSKDSIDDLIENGGTFLAVYPSQKEKGMSIVLTDCKEKKVWGKPRTIMERYIKHYGGTWEGSKCGKRKYAEPHYTKDGKVYFQVSCNRGSAFVEVSAFEKVNAKSSKCGGGSNVHIYGGREITSKSTYKTVNERYEEACCAEQDIAEKVVGKPLRLPKVTLPLDSGHLGGGVNRPICGISIEGQGGLAVEAVDLKDAIHVSHFSNPEEAELERMHIISEVRENFLRHLKNIEPFLKEN